MEFEILFLISMKSLYTFMGYNTYVFSMYDEVRVISISVLSFLFGSCIFFLPVIHHIIIGNCELWLPQCA
jgi:hypothetical protein